MQAKTIKRIIVTKIEEWLATITDERLRLDVKKNLILSGGSITNMYLNETVNDYDIYIQDISVLKRLVTYYIRTIYKHTKDGILYTNDDTNDMCYILDGWLSKDSLVNTLGLAGYIDKNNLDEKIGSIYSAIRTIKPNQIKMYFCGNLGYKNEKKKEDIGKYEVMYISSNSISLSDDIQIVTRFPGSVEEIHKTFDYIHATNYYTTETGIVTNKEALESILTKQLKYQGSQYPLTSIIRMKKFIKRGVVS